MTTGQSRVTECLSVFLNRRDLLKQAALSALALRTAVRSLFPGLRLLDLPGKYAPSTRSSSSPSSIRGLFLPLFQAGYRVRNVRFFNISMREIRVRCTAILRRRGCGATGRRPLAR